MRIKDPVLCSVKWCRNNRGHHRLICYKHTVRKYAINNPLRYTFNALKQNAKRRRKEFNLTFEQFKKFITETKYMDKKGRSGKSYHIDRIKNYRGYRNDNIQLLTNQQNRKKYNELDKDCPF